MEDVSNYEKLKEDARTFYSEIGTVFSPTFKSMAVKYWGIIAIVDGKKIKVIVRKVGDNGNPHFWSVVPGWVTNRYRDTRFATTMKGDPEED